MYFCEDLEDFLEQFKTAQGKTYLVACLGTLIVGYLFLVFALTYPAQVYSGGF